ncbi:hypothetical protein GCM10023080_029780 [Streptomyces pseudoechinosporeus]
MSSSTSRSEYAGAETESVSVVAKQPTRAEGASGGAGAPWWAREGAPLIPGLNISSREFGERLEAQQRATNEVIAERAASLLAEAGHTARAEGREGYRFDVDHLAVRVRAEYANGETWQDAMDEYEELLDASGWSTTAGRSVRFGAHLSVTPPYELAKEMVLEGKRRLEALELKARTRAFAFSGKWRAETEYQRATGQPDEPTDEVLEVAFATCVKPPKRELYPLIRAEIASWDANDGIPPAQRR